jgi:uncharacterized membrane protein
MGEMQMLHKTLCMGFAIVAWLAGTASLIALILFLGGWLSGFSVDAGPVRRTSQALWINGGLMVLWTLQHIGMARSGFKVWLVRRFPAALERSTYMLFTGAALGLVLVFWSPMPSPVFEVTHSWGVIAISIVFLAGWAFALAGIFYDSYLEFVGLKQAFCHVRGLPFQSASFKTGFVFRVCRRPTFLGILVGCWATPHMTLGHLCFAGGMTLFTLVGCHFVERSYVDRYGEAYRAVQAVTPLMLPRLSLLWRREE